MKPTENIPCEKAVVKQLRVLVVRKYEAFRGYFGEEIIKAIENRCEELRTELAESE